MQRSLVFIHGMFLTPKSWQPWLRFFEQRGYRCAAPAWPLHAEEPEVLRARPPAGLGELSLETLIERFAAIAEAEPEKPVLIGHSLGGLVVQVLVNRGLGAAGICISSVAPNKMLSLDWDFFKNSAAIANPLKGDQPFMMTPEIFHATFCNTLTVEESRQAFEAFVVHESRQVLRDSLGRAGHVDLEQPHAPLLFIGGDRDRLIPDRLAAKNAAAYTDESSVSDFQEFPGRDHFICNEPGWREVASLVEGWLAANTPDGARIGFALR